ncbi:Pyruvate, phosphate dikinase 2 [Dichanthelium oligosanthes]|uniref:pyruvate, phosphate dikinase n=1 Tax=Dichanthelium oligosanthes TaxID=888268 RepID=A0A1E5VA48_9POAL|nr:Pyruvate, phosphate dikinase 2 [Dichanthelium oligosanthes]
MAPAAHRDGGAPDSTQRVFHFGKGRSDGNKSMKDLLGGKGANLAEMASIGLSVPPGFTVSTEACRQYQQLAGGGAMPPGLWDEVLDALRCVERDMGAGLGDPRRPLLLSVRSGAAVSMPGMMDTVLNLGLNDDVVAGLAERSGRRFAFDSYRRFLDMFGNVVMGIPHELFEEKLEAMKVAKGLRNDTELNIKDLEDLVAEYKNVYVVTKGEQFPSDPKRQLHLAILAVFDSWNSTRAKKYRSINQITGLKGTAVNVQCMVFGNMGSTSGTGVLFTRNPSTGEKKLYGEFLVNAQGEDVVAGIRTPQELDAMEECMPEPYIELVENCKILERHYKEMMDIEFTVQENRLWMLQCRTGKRAGKGAVKIAVDMVNEGLVDHRSAIKMVEPRHLDQLLHPQVRTETSAEDVGGMHAAVGILTARGGMTSHAAVVARGWGKCCVAGCSSIHVNDAEKVVVVGGKVLCEGDWLSLNGSTGEVILGKLPLSLPALSADLGTFMSWVDEVKQLKVMVNADTPADALAGRKNGAEGIGLCRTEHMFFSSDERIKAMRQMIMADTAEQRQEALSRLLPYQKMDFEGIFRAMDGLRVTIRLLDPPLHEFLPEGNIEDVVHMLSCHTNSTHEEILARVEKLSEVNPMLGFRGCRLGISYPELTAMQARAIFEAAIAVNDQGFQVFPEIMVPLVGTPEVCKILQYNMDWHCSIASPKGTNITVIFQELGQQVSVIRQVADKVFANAETTIRYKIGSMIEVPRAALIADEIAELAEFFSFGTNDLTQMTFGYSRDDIGKFLPTYMSQGILQHDPFEVLDQKGVGELVKIATERGRRSRPDLEVGICGEHGGEPSSVAFFAKAGLDYVSCSPFRCGMSFKFS